MCEHYHGAYRNCPVCGDEPEKRRCSKCFGQGHFWITGEGDEAFEDPKDEDATLETCWECGGEGWIDEEDY